jgi:hypothetical protein
MLHILNDSTVLYENCREIGALQAGGNHIKANVDERIENLGEFPAEGKIA